MGRRRRVIEILVMATSAGIVLFVGDWICAPLPIPAATTTLGGLLFFWIARTDRVTRTIIGLAAGLAVGVGLHLWSHYAEGRMNPEEGLLYHLVVDTGTAALVAGVALGMAYLAQQWLRKRSGSFRKSHEPVG